MNSLDQYILRQCLTPLVLILAIITSIVWMTQSLQRVDIIVEYGQGLGIFLLLSALIVPSLLALIIPFALFGACVFTLHKLHTDSEIAVMFAAGVSRWRLAAPILLITVFGALATYYVNVDLMPRSNRLIKDKVANIRADLAGAVIKAGEFTAFADGFTVYVDDSLPGGNFTGLLINDYRNLEDPKTYMAEVAAIRETPEGPMLFLLRGNVQRLSKDTREVDFLRFQELAINIASLQPRRPGYVLEVAERYPSELLNPDMSQPYDSANAGKLIAEAHARFASPIYAFAYVMVGLYAMIGGPYSRRGYLTRAIGAGAAIFGIRVIGFIAQGLAETNSAFWTIYAIPGAVLIVFAYLLFGPKFRRPSPKDPA